MSRAARNILVCGYMQSLFLGNYADVEVVGHKGYICMVLAGTARRFFQSAYWYFWFRDIIIFSIFKKSEIGVICLETRAENQALHWKFVVNKVCSFLFPFVVCKAAKVTYCLVCIFGFLGREIEHYFQSPSTPDDFRVMTLSKGLYPLAAFTPAAPFADAAPWCVIYIDCWARTLLLFP